jgi:hypothetical protein
MCGVASANAVGGFLSQKPKLHIWLFVVAPLCLVGAGIVYWFQQPKTNGNGFAVIQAQNQVDSYSFGEGDKTEHVITTKAYIIKISKGGWYVHRLS